MSSDIATFTYATVNGTSLVDLPENVIVTRVLVLVTTAWGAGATVTIGINGDIDRYIASGIADLTTIGSYESSARWLQTDSKQVRLDVFHNSSTTGVAYVIVEYESVAGL